MLTHWGILTTHVHEQNEYCGINDQFILTFSKADLSLKQIFTHHPLTFSNAQTLLQQQLSPHLKK